MTRSHPNNAVQKRQRRARLLHSIYTWHRWLGLSVLLWVLVFCISGLLIEAAPTLKLDQRSIQHSWLLKRYGIQAPQAQAHWQTANQQIDSWDQGTSINGEWLQPHIQNVVGVVTAFDLLVIANAKQLSLYSPSGEFVDTLASPQGAIRKLGMNENGGLMVQTDSGVYEADDSMLNWSANSAATTGWSRPITAESIPSQRPAPMHDISYERLLLDIHSGALFGPIGRWLSRLAAVVMILLALSGFYTWFTRFARRPH